MRKVKNEEKKTVSKMLGFSIISGLLEFLVIIFVNMILFFISIFYRPDALPYVLGFFIISYAGSIYWRKLR